jgi:GntR family histidine utilization transcriptional repressor
VSAAKPVPLYERVKLHILQGMQSGEWRDGARLPSEHDLMETLGASRMTVHRALREMSADGLLRRVQGVGTFVRRETPRSALLEITDISEDIAARGHAHRARVVALEAIRADARLAAEFSVGAGAKLFHSVIVHYEDDVPVQLEERFINPAFAPDYLKQDFSAQTASRYLQNIAPAAEVEHVIHAILPDGRTRELLDIRREEPCLRLLRRTWVAEQKTATRSILTHPGSRYSLGSRYEAGWNAKKAGG